MERIELSTLACKANVFPLNYTPKFWLRRMDLNHRSSDYEPDELTGLLYRAKINWWRRQESNLRHSACKADVLPIELYR